MTAVILMTASLSIGPKMCGHLGAMDEEDAGRGASAVVVGWRV